MDTLGIFVLFHTEIQVMECPGYGLGGAEENTDPCRSARAIHCPALLPFLSIHPYFFH